MARNCAHKGCNDFRQTSEATRRRWLGPSLTRRQVLGAGIGFGLSVYAARAIPLGRMFEAAEAEAAAAPDAPVLVSLFLPGGCDLMNTMVPQHDFGRYADLRKHIRLDGAPALGDSGLGIHPSLTTGARGGVKGLYEAGKVGLLPGIDYANPDLSHFHSRHFWETGLITQDAAPGWLGRWLDRHGSPDNALQGLSLDYSLSPVLRSGGAPVAALYSPAGATLNINGTYGKGLEQALAAWDRISAPRPRAPGPAATYGAARLAKQVGDRLAPYAKREDHDGPDPLAPPVPYPAENELGQRLSRLAALISLPLGVRVATVDANGDFDTHAKQPEELGKGLRAAGEALAAFQLDLETRGVADRVLTLVWSEFGRRPKDNDSLGTDHGAGGIAMVVGTRANAGVLSAYPSLSALDRDENLQVTVDFRRVYASLIEQWLGTSAAEVIPNAGAFGRVQLVR
jgi:uncharacterized protein (DUF1501 family)